MRGAPGRGWESGRKTPHLSPQLCRKWCHSAPLRSFKARRCNRCRRRAHSVLARCFESALTRLAVARVVSTDTRTAGGRTCRSVPGLLLHRSNGLACHLPFVRAGRRPIDGFKAQAYQVCGDKGLQCRWNRPGRKIDAPRRNHRGAAAGTLDVALHSRTSARSAVLGKTAMTHEHASRTPRAAIGLLAIVGFCVLLQVGAEIRGRR